MNVNDFEVSDEVPSCRFVEIFKYQRVLMEKYHPIEKKNGLLLAEEIPVNIDDRMAQYRIKDMAWRVTEELAEATGALDDHPDLIVHFHEELADAFHFLVELLISVGFDPAKLPTGPEGQCRLVEMYMDTNGTIRPIDRIERSTVHRACWGVIHQLGQGMNCLKNKPWKQTHMLTDIPKFMSFMLSTLRAFCSLAAVSGLGPNDLYLIYVKKNQVNQFRQRSMY